MWLGAKRIFGSDGQERRSTGCRVCLGLTLFLRTASGLFTGARPRVAVAGLLITAITCIFGHSAILHWEHFGYKIIGRLSLCC